MDMSNLKLTGPQYDALMEIAPEVKGWEITVEPCDIMDDDGLVVKFFKRQTHTLATGRTLDAGFQSAYVFGNGQIERGDYRIQV